MRATKKMADKGRVFSIVLYMIDVQLSPAMTLKTFRAPKHIRGHIVEDSREPMLTEQGSAESRGFVAEMKLIVTCFVRKYRKHVTLLFHTSPVSIASSTATLPFVMNFPDSVLYLDE